MVIAPTWSVPNSGHLEKFYFSLAAEVDCLLLQIRKELPVMLRKALTLGMVFIFALSLLAVSMITCFTYEAEAHGGYDCININNGNCAHWGGPPRPGLPWVCGPWYTH